VLVFQFIHAYRISHVIIVFCFVLRILHSYNMWTEVHSATLNVLGKQHLTLLNIPFIGQYQCFLIYLLFSAVIPASVFQNPCPQLERSLPIARWATTTRKCKDTISSWFRCSFPSHFSTSFVNNMGMRANKEAYIQRNQMLFGCLFFGACNAWCLRFLWKPAAC
jgi:hypothetical protein